MVGWIQGRSCVGVGALIALSISACALETGESSGDLRGGAGGHSSSRDASVATGGVGSGSTPGAGTGGFILNPTDASVGSGGFGTVDRDACAAVTQVPEQIVVFRDATVTDTIVTLKPIALFIMQDRSSSMVGGGGGDPTSWPNSLNAITSFVNDPASGGLDIGLGAFPPVGGDSAECATGSNCGAPIVPIATLPNNAAAMVQGMQTATPPSRNAGTPTECAVRGMINQCLQYQSTSSIRCVAVLVTDGEPTQCDENDDNLADIVRQGFDRGVLTFTLGLPGSNIGFLNQLAVAGGTTAAIDVSSEQAFLNAMNSIREQVTSTSTTVIQTPIQISAPLDCQWRIPPPTGNRTFDKNRVNVQLTPAGGSALSFGYVASEAECEGSENGWYYDDPAAPTEVRVCPSTCETVKAAVGGRVDLLFGCETKPAQIH